MFEDIKKQFSEVVSYSQGIDNPKIDTLFDNWFNNKKKFIDIFDGHLIWEVPYNLTFQLDDTAKRNKFDDFIDYISIMSPDTRSLIAFLVRNKEGFFSNEVVEEFITVDDVVIPKGAKLLKAFKHFHISDRLLDAFQTKASQIIQEDKIHGRLCFSVHPLDYLSVSENTYNWHSCHALDGEFRAGNLAYMQDSCTVICYLKGEDNVKLPNFPDSVPWNSKRWRVLLYLSDQENLIYSGRQYPFSSKPAWEFARREFLHIIHGGATSWCDWTDPYITEVPNSYGSCYDTVEPYTIIRGRISSIKDYVIEKSKLPFNDVLHSSYYIPHFTAYKNYPWMAPLKDKIEVGRDCNCLWCGENKITNSESFMCDNCNIAYGTEETESVCQCDSCNRRLFVEDSFLVEGIFKFCPDCAETQAFECECCHEYCLNEHRTFYKPKEMYVCPDCFGKLSREEKK